MSDIQNGDIKIHIYIPNISNVTGKSSKEKKKLDSTAVTTQVLEVGNYSFSRD